MNTSSRKLKWKVLIDSRIEDFFRWFFFVEKLITMKREKMYFFVAK